MNTHTTKANLYWGAYKNLEKEVIDLSINILFDDDNFNNNVHSMTIADLILRAASFLESISKDLYFENDGKGDRAKLAYDHDCLYKILIDWGLKHREVKLKLATHTLTKEKYIFYRPFEYEEVKKWRNQERPIYQWNKSYQALKHDLLTSIPTHGTIYSLINIMSALYILCSYFDGNEYYIGSEAVPERINTNFELFEPSFSDNINKSIYVAVYFGPEWDSYTKLANELFAKGGDIQHDFNCCNALRFARKKLLLNKGQGAESICPGLSKEIIDYLEKLKLSDYNIEYNLHKK